MKKTIFIGNIQGGIAKKDVAKFNRKFNSKFNKE